MSSATIESTQPLTPAQLYLIDTIAKASSYRAEPIAKGWRLVSSPTSNHAALRALLVASDRMLPRSNVTVRLFDVPSVRLDSDRPDKLTTSLRVRGSERSEEVRAAMVIVQSLLQAGEAGFRINDDDDVVISVRPMTARVAGRIARAVFNARGLQSFAIEVG